MIFTDYNEAICENAVALTEGQHQVLLTPTMIGTGCILGLTLEIGTRTFKVVMGDPEPYMLDSGEWGYEASIRLCAPFEGENPFADTWDFTTPVELVRKVSQLKRLFAVV